MSSSEKPTQYDGIVIGTGQGGKPLAVALAKAGWKTAIIENDAVGGTCVNVGCTPTKTMVASARVAHLARRGSDYGVMTGNISIDMKKVRARKQAIVDMFRTGSERGIEKTDKLDLIRGTATFTGPHTLNIDLNDGGTASITSEKIFINAGARPLVPALDGLDKLRTAALDSTSIMELDSVPEHLIVLGGGYIGLEFAQMFRRFGSNVTIVQRDKQLLGREDNDVAEAVTDIMREDGINVLLDTAATSVRDDGDSGIMLTVNENGQEQSISGSHLLVAVGRVPNSDTLNLEAAGIETDTRGFIKVDDKLQTNIDGVFAFGDIKGGPAFTHIAYDDFRILRANHINNGNASMAGRLVPYTVFIDPELGRVGMSESEALASGRKIRVAKLPMTHVARAIEADETRGFMKVVLDAESEQILGCAILSIEGGEIATVIQMAMMGKVPYTAIRDGVFSHPTLSESLNNLFMALDA